MTDSTLSMEDQDRRHSLRRHLIVWSEEHEESASKIAERHADLVVTGRLGKTQLNGLSSIAQSTKELSTVLSFVKHQGEKAERAGHREVKDFWNELDKELSAIGQEALTLATEAGLKLPPEEARAKKSKAALNPVSMAMAREWLQHFVAHSLMLAGSEE